MGWGGVVLSVMALSQRRPWRSRCSTEATTDDYVPQLAADRAFASFDTTADVYVRDEFPSVRPANETPSLRSETAVSAAAFPD